MMTKTDFEKIEQDRQKFNQLLDGIRSRAREPKESYTHRKVTGEKNSNKSKTASKEKDER